MKMTPEDKKQLEFVYRASECRKCFFRYHGDHGPKDAAMCVTEKHGLVRCYQCFDVCRNTEQLFAHYTANHNGQNGTIKCCLCHQKLSYKSVSTHVISMHLFQKKKVQPQPIAQLSPPPGHAVNQSIFNGSDFGALREQLNTCQRCNRTYSNAAEAASCITSHQLLRCYLCLAMCGNTEQLFEHFQSSHRNGGKPSTITCPFCNMCVSFKSVSCHVISVHLAQPQGPAFAIAGPSRAVMMDVSRDRQNGNGKNDKKIQKKTTTKETGKKEVKKVVKKKQSKLRTLIEKRQKNKSAKNKKENDVEADENLVATKRNPKVKAKTKILGKISTKSKLIRKQKTKIAVARKNAPKASASKPGKTPKAGHLKIKTKTPSIKAKTDNKDSKGTKKTIVGYRKKLRKVSNKSQPSQEQKAEVLESKADKKCTKKSCSYKGVKCCTC